VAALTQVRVLEWALFASTHKQTHDCEEDAAFIDKAP
jgi:hypothetical protein